MMKGKRIRALRKRLGMTPGKFAELVGVNKSTISRWENDESETKPSVFAEKELLRIEANLRDVNQP